MVTVDVPCDHIAFALVDGIYHVAVKLRATWRVGVRLDVDICTWEWGGFKYRQFGRYMG